MSMDWTTTPFYFRGEMKWRQSTPEEQDEMKRRLIEWGAYITEDDLNGASRDEGGKK